MPLGKKAIGVMMAAMIAVVLVNPLAASISNTGSQTVTNETLTIQNDTWQDLEGYNIDANSETVWIENGTDTFEQGTAGTHYELAEENGSIRYFDNNNLVEVGNESRVTYTYQRTSDIVSTISNIVITLVAILVLVTVAGPITDALD